MLGLQQNFCHKNANYLKVLRKMLIWLKLVLHYRNLIIKLMIDQNIMQILFSLVFLVNIIESNI